MEVDAVRVDVVFLRHDIDHVEHILLRAHIDVIARLRQSVGDLDAAIAVDRHRLAGNGDRDRHVEA